MRRARRVLVCVPAVAVLVWASFVAETAASASLASSDPHDIVSLERAVKRVPSDPELHEMLALGEGSGSTGGTAGAVEHLRQALVLRPISPYTWANLAAAQYAAGITGEPFQVALERAAQLGPNEPAVQELVALYGLAVLDEMRPQTRAAIDRMVASGVKRDPAAILQIAQRRGRVDAACRHVDSSRLAGDLSKLCITRGATQ